MAVHVVELQPPGKVLEGDLAIHAATDVYENRMERRAARIRLLNSTQRMRERAPFPVVKRNSWPENQVVLLDTRPVNAAPVQHDSEVRETVKRHGLHRPIPSAEC